MSGAEIAGLVLGSIPLLVSGLEHYGEGVRTIQKMRNSSREFAKIKQALECEQHMFLNCLEILLKDDIEEVVLADLIANASNHEKWLDPSIDQCLSRKLGRSYGPYLETARSMGRSIQEFRDSLQLGNDGKGPFTVDKRSVSTALKRIKFGLKMRAYVDMMKEISGHNKRLCQLTDQSRTLAPVVVTRKRVPDFEKARHHAQTIFVTLQRKLASSCNVDHKASLYMRPVESSGRSTLAGVDPGRFRIVIHHQVTSPSSSASPWIMEEAEIRTVQDASDDGGQTSSVSTTRAVRFQTAASAQTQAQASVVEIQDLCSTLKQLRNSTLGCDVCLGYISDAAKSCRHGFYWPNRPLFDTASPRALSLAELLQQGHRLAESEKRHLALALALGMLRLYDTPWLARQWGKREVILFHRRGMVVASHPFISAEMPTAHAHSAQRLLPYFDSCRLIKEETIFALGILLIELALEQPFESLRTAEDLNPDGTKHQLSDYCAADRLVEEVFAVAGERYANVVRRCVHCQFDEHKSTLSSAPFRRKFYEGVVAELELDLEDIMSL